MTMLVDLVDIFRSKNAGPFQITFDLFFPDYASYDRVLASNVLTPERVAPLYGLDQVKVRMIPFRRIRAIKITIDRPGASSGSPGDRDVYGAQQHGPLLCLEVP